MVEAFLWMHRFLLALSPSSRKQAWKIVLEVVCALSQVSFDTAVVLHLFSFTEVHS